MSGPNQSSFDKYLYNIQKMVQWRTAEAVCLWIVVILVPALLVLEVKQENYILVYFGILVSLLFCNNRRVLYRNIAKNIFDND